MADWSEVVKGYEAKIEAYEQLISAQWQTHQVIGAGIAGVLIGILIGAIL